MHAEVIAQELLDALDQGATISSLIERSPEFGWAEGYELAEQIIDLRVARGERRVGRKIGFTNRNIWAEYGATMPIWGHVYDTTVVSAPENQTTISLRRTARPKLETEIAFKLNAALPAGVVEPEEILHAVEWFAPAFEIVDCHFADWKFAPGESAADFALHWRLVVGDPCPVRIEDIPTLAEQLCECQVALSRNDEIIAKGIGANALDHPALALAHLASVLSEQPQFEPLRAGEVITTGTLTAAMPVAQGDTWTASFEGLTGVTQLSVNFTS